MRNLFARKAPPKGALAQQGPRPYPSQPTRLLCQGVPRRAAWIARGPSSHGHRQTFVSSACRSVLSRP
jgi:hypothetical protein